MGDVFMDEISYSIKEVSERIGETYRSLHYWQEKLELQINRDGAGNRIYYENDIEILEKVKELKLKGMSLDGIKALFQEKGLIQKTETKNLIVVDEKSLELKEYLFNEIKEAIAQELQNTNNKLDQILQDNHELRQSNEELREELRKLQRQSDEHYNKIDTLLTTWRNKQPWYKTLFKSK
jgi:Predicted transcriptional regulators